MPKIPDAGGGDFQTAPAGAHLARCSKLIDLGTQTVEWQGKEKKQYKILFAWDLVHERMDPTTEYPEPKCFTVFGRYTFSLHEKGNLRPMLQSWFPKWDLEECERNGEIDLSNIPNQPCYLTVTHGDSKGKTYANVGAVMPAPDPDNVPELDQPPVYFWMDHGKCKAEFDAMSENVQGIIKKSPEYADWIKTVGLPMTDEQAAEIDAELDTAFGFGANAEKEETAADGDIDF